MTEEFHTSSHPLSPYDYYVSIVDLLRLPVVRSRPVLQERVISLLVRILDEYQRVGSRQNTSGGTQEQQQPTLQVITPLGSSITQDLCEFILSKNSSEQTRSLVTWLIVLMTRVDETSKKAFFDLLATGACSLAKTIEEQLISVINEINKLSPNSRRRLQESEGVPHIQHSESMTRLTASYASVASGPSTSTFRASQPQPGGSSETQASNDLELATLQPLFSMRSEQSRLCKILKLMLYLSSCPEVSLKSLESLSSLWKRLSDVLDALQGSTESTIRMFQPLVECMCLAHANHAQTTVSTNSRNLPALLQRRGPMTNWNDVSLPRSMNIPSFDGQNIIIFNGFPEESRSSDEVVAARGPPADLIRPLSPEPAVPSEVPEDMIAWFAEKHRVSLNQILRKYSTNISESALWVFLKYPRALDFDVKRKFLQSRFKSLQQRSVQFRQDEEHISVSRARLFEDSFNRLTSKSPQDWKKRFVIRFRSENSFLLIII